MFVNVTRHEPPPLRLADAQEAREGMPIRVLSVGDDPLVHEGIRALLSTESDIELVGEAGGEEFDSIQFMSLLPAVVLMGPSLSGYGSVRAIARLHAFDPCTPVIVIASRSADVRTRRAIGAGAHGCLLSSNVRLELAKAIRAVASGHRFLDGDSAVQLMQVSTEEAHRRGFYAESLLDPCFNLRAGWQILDSAYQLETKTYGPGQEALQHAISRYNTGDTQRGIDHGYLTRVMAALKQGPATTSMTKGVGTR